MLKIMLNEKNLVLDTEHVMSVILEYLKICKGKSAWNRISKNWGD